MSDVSMTERDPIPRDEARSVHELLGMRAALQPERHAFTHVQVDNDGVWEESITYAGLDARARGVASLLAARARPGDRALLIFPAGLDYLAAFFGCLYAGVIALPVYPPEHRRVARRLAAISPDGRPSLVLASPSLAQRASSLAQEFPALSELPWFPIDAAFEYITPDWEPEVLEPDIAFLQYTSGSSGQPKGVVVSHANLLDNLQRIEEQFGHTPSDHQVSWLPPYHDMGLIATLLAALYSGHPCSFMSPFAFLSDPSIWMRQVSERRATVVGAPNFGYELAARRTSEEMVATLDLSCLQLAFCGAEPIRAGTIDRFVRHFRPAGLGSSVFSAGYGIAEATVLVSMTPRHRASRIRTLDREAFRQGKIQAPWHGGETVKVVGCGPVIGDHELQVVDRESGTPCGEDEIGELWLRGPSVARGYWSSEEETAEIFGNRMMGAPDDEGAGFMRTGDLGFVADGEIYVTGRLKDLIILHGVNLYPQDLELTVETAHPAVRAGCCAAFAVDDGTQEHLVIVAEVRGEGEEEVADAVRRALNAEHQAPPSSVVLIAPSTLAKTSSGKVARPECRRAFEEGSLTTLHRWDAAATAWPGAGSSRKTT